jgi:hypothetical protein
MFEYGMIPLILGTLLNAQLIPQVKQVLDPLTDRRL